MSGLGPLLLTTLSFDRIIGSYVHFSFSLYEPIPLTLKELWKLRGVTMCSLEAAKSTICNHHIVPCRHHMEQLRCRNLKRFLFYSIFPSLAYCIFLFIFWHPEMKKVQKHTKFRNHPFF